MARVSFAEEERFPRHRILRWTIVSARRPWIDHVDDAARADRSRNRADLTPASRLGRLTLNVLAPHTGLRAEAGARRLRFGSGNAGAGKEESDKEDLFHR